MTDAEWSATLGIMVSPPMPCSLDHQGQPAAFELGGTPGGTPKGVASVAVCVPPKMTDSEWSATQGISAPC